jgi:hypothetical protein
VITLKKNGGSGDSVDWQGTADVSWLCSKVNQSCALPKTTYGGSKLTLLGYTFTDRWGTNAECTGTTYTYADSNIDTYYACKEANKIYISWYDVEIPGDGPNWVEPVTGEQNAFKSTVNYDGEIITPEKGLNKTGRKFLGWVFSKPSN